MGGERRPDPLLKLSKAQWTVLRRDQIRAAGFSDRQIEGLVHKGVLFLTRFPKARGLYTHGTDRPPDKGVLLIAQWSVGLDAYLTCRTALGLAKVCGQYLSKITVAAPRQTVRQRKPPVDLVRRAHAPSRLREDGPLRFAPVEHAMLDLSARGATPEELNRLIVDAIHQNRLDHAAMRRLLVDHAGEKGTLGLAEAYGAYLPKPTAKSGLERSFDAGLKTRPWIPEPEPNQIIMAGGVAWEVDRYWPKHKLGVELHGGGYHNAKQDLNKDTFKAVKLGLVGIQILPITDDRWDLEPERCLDDLEEGLRLRGWAGQAA